MGVEVKRFVVGGVNLLDLGARAWTVHVCEVDGCWVSEWECWRLLGGGPDRVGEDMWMDVVEVSASELCVLHDVVVVAVDAVHADVSADVTAREEEEDGEWSCVCNCLLFV
ncbi:hypothetical protein NDU88_002155 [Pleurodeles waltl]|uniref:Uncharacterized protein n=1 Tax=Pleurodeles waltl TaxID=8319 RepID=A0AAV7KSR8_PLEWA|nr:hypothetical protein NDU88_002155 [Pleurodeles waltl]